LIKELNFKGRHTRKLNSMPENLILQLPKNMIYSNKTKLAGVKMSYKNHLQNSDSPYLLQHQNNPVDWYPYSDEAFIKAKKENKLIFLSIGYSTCHWCHVMARESFENKKIAKILNKDYISIKMDREEYPDIDKYYQHIYQIMHRRAGGWPLTIIMTPNKKPFYSATYIPPHHSQFGAGLDEILISIANDWHTNQTKIIKIANNLEEFLKEKQEIKIEKIDDDILKKVIEKALNEFDTKFGGFKGAPKFPMESTLDLLIDTYLISKNDDLLKQIDFSLTKMAMGGIFDQIEGGFYRYSTDEKWLIPHFEKMLYNNANIPSLYIRMYKITKNPLYKEIVIKTIEEMNKRYRSKTGLFFSASNADSDNVEGKYFTYYYDEVESEFQQFENKKELLEYFGIKKYGEFNGRNNPIINSNIKPKNYEKAIKILQDIRAKKNFPFIDTKKITSWNTMMIDTLFKASIFDEKYKDEAVTTLNILLKTMYKDKLYHSFNTKSPTPALLEDYSYLIKALITAYEYTFEEKYLNFANKLAKEVEKFHKDNKWHMNENHLVKADFSDSSYASSLSILANNFIDLATINYDYTLYEKAHEIIKQASFYINKYPFYYPTITKAYLKTNYKEYVINSTKPLYNKEFNYPYILWKKGENYELCTIEKCLIQDTDLEKIKEYIK
jgi:uncharacterized protein YyaL (SSP411 family)